MTHLATLCSSPYHDCDFPKLDQAVITPLKELQPATVTAVILSLGSNHQAHQHLCYAQQRIAKLGKTAWSTEYVNPDFTASADNPKPDYTNQCAVLWLKNPMSLAALLIIYNKLEQDCKREHKRNRQKNNKSTMSFNKQMIADNLFLTKDKPIKLVTLDIDILAVQLMDGEWHILNERYPFKDHENVGLVELAG